MPYRKTPFINNEIYHVYNRGVAKLPIFYNQKDKRRLIDVVNYYQFQGPKPQFSQIRRFKQLNFEKSPKIIEILCYCLMPNHFHFLLRQLKDNGISEFMNKVGNSYTKYFNTRHERVGPLLQGQFKAVRIEDDDQFMHVSRYIHLNPVASYLVKDPKEYQWSSYLDYISLRNDGMCVKEPILSMFRIGYKKSLEAIDYLLIDLPVVVSRRHTRPYV
ncbi:transposase [Candidatus Microgenomates bacterium]|nr:transposase [Candidatus Microgenomates bacterium]